MEKPQWGNPNDFSLCFRIAEKKYAIDFLKKGSIKFGLPRNWVLKAETEGIGRGDPFEGAIAGFNCFDLMHFSEFRGKYSGEQFESHCVDGTVYMKRSPAMDLPCFCLFTLRNSSFVCPQECGKQQLSTYISSDLFRDFCGEMTEEEYLLMPENEKPAIVVIEDFAAFREKMCSSLMELGIKREEILVRQICYYDFHKYGKYSWFDLDCSFPYELTYKNISFEHQSECRFIINSKNREAMDYLKKNIVSIGSLEGIAQMMNEYPLQGLKVVLTGNVELSRNQ